MEESQGYRGRDGRVPVGLTRDVHPDTDSGEYGGIMGNVPHRVSSTVSYGNLVSTSLESSPVTVPGFEVTRPRRRPTKVPGSGVDRCPS